MVGGDPGYYYVGRYETDRNVLRGTLRVQRYNEGYVSVFGSLEAFDVAVAGPLDGSIMMLTGALVEHPDIKMSVICTKRESLEA